MVLHACRIIMKDKTIVVSQSAESSLYFLEGDTRHKVSQIEIEAKDENKIHSYSCCSVEESIENLMNL
ncbi:conserved hypothetical protein [Vibrio chagasii]|nr:conserved hypothetical protein [Vibrio chagasii]